MILKKKILDFDPVEFLLLYLKIESYLPRSSLTHFSGPLAVTVAARGRSNNNAISPK